MTGTATVLTLTLMPMLMLTLMLTLMLMLMLTLMLALMLTFMLTLMLALMLALMLTLMAVHLEHRRHRGPARHTLWDSLSVGLLERVSRELEVVDSLTNAQAVGHVILKVKPPALLHHQLPSRTKEQVG